MINLLSTNRVDELYDQIEGIVTANRKKVVYQINNTMLETYFLIGKLIVENEQNGNIKVQYGRQVLKELSKRLTQRFGKGFSVSNMQYMRRFYLVYQKQQTVSVKLDADEKQQPVAVKFDSEQKSQTVSDQFNETCEIQPLAGHLSWSHYCYLLSIEDDDERSF